MASFNKIILVGNLTRNPESRTIPNGQNVTNFTVATNHRYKTANGEQRDEACFTDITVWGKQGENCQRFLQMGSSVLVEGRLRQENWEDKETGKNRSKHTVVAESVRFLNSSSGGGQNTSSSYQAPADKGDTNPSSSGDSFQAPPSMPSYDDGLDDNDDVPF